MAGLLPGVSANDGTSEDGSSRSSRDKQEEMSPWYMSRKEIEDNSPSRRDGISLKKETYLRQSYCKFLQDLGKRLEVPQITIATAILFCHRFFLCNSHSKNDRMIIATVCMFLAGKVEDTLRSLRDVVLLSYEIAFRTDPMAAYRIRQKEEYEERKKIILNGERMVLATLGFDLAVHHPYIPLIQAVKKLKITQNDVPRVAWYFINDGLMTSLPLQFKPHQIAAGAIFLAAKFLKVKLPSETPWWRELHVNQRQLEEISSQMLELYEQRKVPPPRGSEAEASTVGGSSHPSPVKMAAAIDRDLLDISGSRTEHAEEDKGKSACRNKTAGVEEQGSFSESHRSGSMVGPNLKPKERSDGQTPPKVSLEIDRGKAVAEREHTEDKAERRDL